MNETVNIHGKNYETVASRVQRFLADEKKDCAIRTELVSADAECVVVKAYIVDLETDRVLATGYAEEYRSASKINRTSALENAETSAVGRALAFFGYAGSDIASADEVSRAIATEKTLATDAQLAALDEHLEAGTMGDKADWYKAHRSTLTKDAAATIIKRLSKREAA